MNETHTKVRGETRAVFFYEDGSQIESPSVTLGGGVDLITVEADLPWEKDKARQICKGLKSMWFTCPFLSRSVSNPFDFEEVRRKNPSEVLAMKWRGDLKKIESPTPDKHRDMPGGLHGREPSEPKEQPDPESKE